MILHLFLSFCESLSSSFPLLFLPFPFSVVSSVRSYLHFIDFVLRNHLLLHPVRTTDRTRSPLLAALLSTIPLTSVSRQRANEAAAVSLVANPSTNLSIASFERRLQVVIRLLHVGSGSSVDNSLSTMFDN